MKKFLIERIYVILKWRDHRNLLLNEKKKCLEFGYDKIYRRLRRIDECKSILQNRGFLGGGGKAFIFLDKGIKKIRSFLKNLENQISELYPICGDMRRRI